MTAGEHTTCLQTFALPRNETGGDVFGKYKNEMWKLQNNYLCKSTSVSKVRKIVMVCSRLNSLVTTVCIPSVQKSPLKPTDWQITLWYLLWAHKMKTFFKCFPRCLNCTRKWKRSRTLPTSSCRTNACMPRWNSTFQRGDRNDFSASPRESNDHHSEKHSLLGQCPQPSSTRKGRKGEDGTRGVKERNEVVGREINKNQSFYRIFPSSI